MKKAWWKSSTMWGAIMLAAAHVAMKVATDPSPASIGTAIGEAVGIVIAAKGAREAIAKNGSGA